MTPRTSILSGVRVAWLAAALVAVGACRPAAPADRVRVSGQVEATEVRVAAQVAGRILELRIAEGDRLEVGAVVARLDTADAELALARTRAERDQANAQLRLLLAGARAEDVRQADAQTEAAQAEVAAAEAELAAAQIDVDRFERLLASSSGTRKQLDDAVARRDVLRERTAGARDRVRASRENAARLRVGARPEEIDAARARLAAADAQVATWQKAIDDATVTTPLAGIVTQTLIDLGELAAPRSPIVAITDLDHAWANVYVDEPVVPRLRLGQPAVLFTDAGGMLEGTVSSISPRAEFTPRNVQTAEDRSKLVYRVKVSVDNTGGVLKVGMPVEAEIQFVQ
jgi:HlyD family secretion protein